MTDSQTEITVSWKGDMTFVGENAAGGSVQMGTLDGKPGVGPMQLLLVGLAGCTGIDIVEILQKKRITISDMKIRVLANRAPDFPMIWTNIYVTYYVWGESIPPKELEQAIRLSEDKYCSVGIMLGKSAKIGTKYFIMNTGEQIG